MSLLRRIEKGGSGGQGGSGGSGGDNPPEVPKLAALRARKQSVVGPDNRPGSPAPGRNENSYMDLKTRVQQKLLNEMDQSMDISRKNEVRAHIEELFNSILTEESMVLSRAERQRLFDAIIAEILGFGPLEPLLADDTVTEIMVNGPKNIFV